MTNHDLDSASPFACLLVGQPTLLRRRQYRLADYLEQVGRQRRDRALVPPLLWQAAAVHISNPVDAARLGDVAADRLLYCHAIPLLDRGGQAGDETATLRLAELLIKRGDHDGAISLLRARAENGNRSAASRLAHLLGERGDQGGAIAILRAQADTGDRSTAERLADLLITRADLDGAISVLNTLADTGSWFDAHTDAGKRWETTGCCRRVETIQFRIVDVGQVQIARIVPDDFRPAGGEDRCDALATVSRVTASHAFTAGCLWVA